MSRLAAALAMTLVAACPAPPLGDAGRVDDAGTDGGAPVPCWASDGAWPNDDVVAADDPAASLGNNLSGAVWDDEAAALLVVQNGPSLLHRLVLDDITGRWTIDPTFASRTLLYPSGGGEPDSEGVTIADDGFVWVSTERDNQVSLTSRLSVLRFDVSGGPSLVATHEWDLTADLATAGVVAAPNAGLEAITFVPDDLLTDNGFRGDDGTLYDPAAFGEHAGGLFLVGLEETGDVFAYALALDGAATRVAAVDVALPVTVSLELDRETGLLFAGCDDNCGNLTQVLALEGGAFTVIATLNPAPSLGGGNNEGIAFAPSSEGSRTVFWTRDGAGDGNALFTGSFPAGRPCD